MLYRLVRPMRRKGSRNIYFQQRIPRDVRRLAVGRTLALPIGEEFATVRISPGAANIKVSLRTSDPAEGKIRHAQIAGRLEETWRGLRADSPVTLTQRQATALAGELYRAWAAGEGRERTNGMVRIPGGEIAEGEAAKEWAWVPDDDLDGR